MIVCSDYDCATFIDVADRTSSVSPPAAGESAQAEFERLRAERVEHLRTSIPYLVAVGVLGAAIVFFFTAIFLDLRVGAALAAAMTLALAWYVARQLPEIVDWQHGAEAERRVGIALDGLERLGFVTLYDRRLRGRGGNIDSVTVGPTGVFLVETKYRRRGVEVLNGRLEVGGRRQDDVVRQVTELAVALQVSVADAMNEHHLTVVPVICIGNRNVDPGHAGGIRVVGASNIAKSIATGQSVLTPADIQALARTLDDALLPFQRRPTG